VRWIIVRLIEQLRRTRYNVITLCFGARVWQWTAGMWAEAEHGPPIITFRVCKAAAKGQYFMAVAWSEGRKRKGLASAYQRGYAFSSWFNGSGKKGEL
jgi:hypothetical protein